MNKETKEWMRFFENISIFYRKFFLEPSWNKYPNFKDDFRHSWAIFLASYAFEKQGKDPSYAHAAADTVLEVINRKNKKISEDAERKIWKYFASLLENRNLNPRRNPLYPGKESLFSRMKEVGELNLLFYIKRLVVEGEARNAFNFLTSIRGVGKKIASFFLRDLKDKFRLNLKSISIQDRVLFQPIDIWVRRTIQYLARNPEMHDEEIALYIIENSLNPEQVNMGIWVFSAIICGSKYKHKKSLQKLNTAKDEVRNYFEKMKIICGIDFYWA